MVHVPRAANWMTTTNGRSCPCVAWRSSKPSCRLAYFQTLCGGTASLNRLGVYAVHRCFVEHCSTRSMASTPGVQPDQLARRCGTAPGNILTNPFLRLVQQNFLKCMQETFHLAGGVREKIRRIESLHSFSARGISGHKPKRHGDGTHKTFCFTGQSPRSGSENIEFFFFRVEHVNEQELSRLSINNYSTKAWSRPSQKHTDCSS